MSIISLFSVQLSLYPANVFGKTKITFVYKLFKHFMLLLPDVQNTLVSRMDVKNCGNVELGNKIVFVFYCR